MKSRSQFSNYKSPQPANSNNRLFAIGVGLFAIWACLVLWTFKVQIVESEEYSSSLERKSMRKNIIKPARGKIYDRNNDVLATNVEYDLSEGKGRKRVINRILPYGELAAHTIGKVGKNGDGRLGLELSLNKELAGIEGWENHKVDVHGKIYDGYTPDVTQPIPGFDIILTLDRRIQEITEVALKRGVEDVKAISGTAIVVNPHNGEILAQANYPTVDFNMATRLTSAQMRNDVVEKSFEPGSTMKILTTAIAMNEGKVKESDRINTENGVYYVCGKREKPIRDHDANESLSLEEILAYSSNIGYAKVAQRLDSITYYKYFRQLGFGTPTGIQLQGETAGTLHHPKDVHSWNCGTQETMSFGHGITVNPLQMTMALSVVANGGKLFSPKLVKEYRNSTTGETVKVNKDHFIRRVISEETSSRVRKLMKSVVEYGTAKSLKIDGISFSGKTGTAEKYSQELGRYDFHKQNSSFVGFLPAESPQYVIYVVLDEPTVHTSGARTAGPVFKEIATRLSFISDFGIAAKTLDFEEEPRITIPNFEKSKVAEVQKWASDNKIPVEYENDGELVLNQFPLAGEVVKKELVLKIKRRHSWDGIPDLKGLSLKQAISLLNERGIEAKYTGEGVVEKQFPLPGSSVEKNGVCELILERGQG